MGLSIPSMDNITCLKLLTLLTLLITLLANGRSQKRVTCQAGHFKAGQSAFVTCNFNHSVEDIEHHIFVIHYPFDVSKHFEGKGVVRCFRADDNKRNCQAVEGVQFDSNITDRLTLEIPDVTTDFAGNYMCQLVPPDDTTMVVCSLTVEETPVRSESGSWLPFILFTSIVLCLLSIVAVVICIAFIRTKCARREDRRGDYTRDVQQTDPTRLIAEQSV